MKKKNQMQKLFVTPKTFYLNQGDWKLVHEFSPKNQQQNKNNKKKQN